MAQRFVCWNLRPTSGSASPRQERNEARTAYVRQDVFGQHQAGQGSVCELVSLFLPKLHKIDEAFRAPANLGDLVAAESPEQPVQAMADLSELRCRQRPALASSIDNDAPASFDPKLTAKSKAIATFPPLTHATCAVARPDSRRQVQAQDSRHS